MPEKFLVRFEGVNGPVLERQLTLEEMKTFLADRYWPGWLGLWERKDGKDMLSMLSPEYVALCRRLCHGDATPVH